MPNRNPNNVCAYPGCSRMHSAHGYCQGHLRQLKLNQPLHEIKRRPTRRGVCAFPGCGRKHSARGYCNTHAQQLRDNKPLTPIKTLRSRGIECEFDGCEKPVQASGLCAGHYQQQRQGGYLVPLRTPTNQTPEDMARRRRASRLMFHYGVTLDWYDNTLAEQDGRCAICGNEPSIERRYLVVDHDHSHCRGRSGCKECVRGLLCDSCNFGLGAFTDDIDRLRAAVTYLEKCERKEVPRGDTRARPETRKRTDKKKSQE